MSQYSIGFLIGMGIFNSGWAAYRAFRRRAPIRDFGDELARSADTGTGVLCVLICLAFIASGITVAYRSHPAEPEPSAMEMAIAEMEHGQEEITEHGKEMPVLERRKEISEVLDRVMQKLPAEPWNPYLAADAIHTAGLNATPTGWGTRVEMNEYGTLTVTVKSRNFSDIESCVVAATHGGSNYSITGFFEYGRYVWDENKPDYLRDDCSVGRAVWDLLATPTPAKFQPWVLYYE